MRPRGRGRRGSFRAAARPGRPDHQHPRGADGRWDDSQARILEQEGAGTSPVRSSLLRRSRSREPPRDGSARILRAVRRDPAPRTPGDVRFSVESIAKLKSTEARRRSLHDVFFRSRSDRPRRRRLRPVDDDDPADAPRGRPASDDEWRTRLRTPARCDWIAMSSGDAERPPRRRPTVTCAPRVRAEGEELRVVSLEIIERPLCIRVLADGTRDVELLAHRGP